ncbi:MAG: hypothetical protein E6I52_20130 [Chloroflexi bacterium]|nr:MAG: hypothetical protein E6I52_20130 [Chloroflexota bacterium]
MGVAAGIHQEQIGELSWASAWLGRNRRAGPGHRRQLGDGHLGGLGACVRFIAGRQRQAGGQGKAGNQAAETSTAASLAALSRQLQREDRHLRGGAHLRLRVFQRGEIPGGARQPCIHALGHGRYIAIERHALSVPHAAHFGRAQYERWVVGAR